MRFALPAAMIVTVCAIAPAFAAETRQVVLERDMTCEQAAKLYLGDAKRFDAIHAVNELGPRPHKLKKGQTLNLPVDDKPVVPAAAHSADARLTAVNGSVRVRSAEKQDWDRGQLGNDLFRGWRVNTLEKASAEVTFEADRAKVELREQTVIIIYDVAAKTARVQGGRAVLESGQLRSRLADLAGKDRVTIDTPSARAALGQGATLLDVDDTGTTRMSNHDGKTALLTMRKDGKPRGGEVAVRAGMGSKVLPGKLPTPPRPLPAVPAFAEQPHLVLAVDGKQGVLVTSWQPVAAAARYRVEVADEPEFKVPLASVVVDAPVTRLESRDLPVGSYHVRLTSIDADKFESKPSAPGEFKIVAMGRKAGTGTLAIDAGQKLDVSDELVAPDGLRCDLGEPGRPLKLTRPGQATVRCSDELGHELPAIVVEVGIPEVKVEMIAGEALSRGQNARLELAAKTNVLAELRLDADAGVTLTEVTATRGRRAFRVTPGPGAKDTFAIRVVLGEGADAVQLAAPSVTLWAEPVDSEPIVVTRTTIEPPPPWLAFVAGASGFAFTDGPLIGGSEAETLFLGRVRFDIYAADVALIEVGFAGGPAISPDGNDSYVGGEMRLGLAPRFGHFRPFVAGGVGLGKLDERRTPFDVTGGFGYVWGPGGGLRLEVEHRWWGDDIRSLGGGLSYVMEM